MLDLHPSLCLVIPFPWVVPRNLSSRVQAQGKGPEVEHNGHQRSLLLRS